MYSAIQLQVSNKLSAQRSGDPTHIALSLIWSSIKSHRYFNLYELFVLKKSTSTTQFSNRREGTGADVYRREWLAGKDTKLWGRIDGLLCPVSTIPLPFFRSVAIPLPLQVRTELLETSFRIHGDEVTRTLIGCPPTAERKKMWFDPICYGTAVTAQRQVETATATKWWKPGIRLWQLVKWLKSKQSWDGGRQTNGRVE